MQFSHFRLQLYPKLNEKACNYLLIIYFIKCSLIFQDSYVHVKWSYVHVKLRYDHHSGFSYSGHLDYVHNRMTTFVRAFNVPAV